MNSHNNNLNTQSQLRYLLSWFSEWSEMQKDDFIPILAQEFCPQYFNGIVEGMEKMNCSGRPPSIFQCQVKLFHEWFESWSEAERGQLLEKFKEVDSEFMEKFDTSLKKGEEETGVAEPVAITHELEEIQTVEGVMREETDDQ